jgi:hypothetical protein
MGNTALFTGGGNNDLGSNDTTSILPLAATPLIVDVIGP